MRTRKDIEEFEDKNLAVYAMRSKNSAGRKYDNSQHEFRTCYQRDRDRIVHCEAFRKLEYKTQVFVILEGDYYRTRLTHTIEVAQIARTIGRALGLNEDLIEAIALAHDLGHPPFGHAGEEILKNLMTDKKNKNEDYGGFDHNFRSYQIVAEFEKKYPNFRGLDLSREVIAGILKHETVYDNKGDIGEYKDNGPTLEAKVVDIADALAYLSHDVDDGLTSGCITEEDLKDSILWRRSYENVKNIIGVSDKAMMKYQIVKFLIDQQTKDLLTFTSEQLNNLNFLTSRDVQKYCLENSESHVVGFSSRMNSERKELQELLYEKLYSHFRVLRMTEKAKRIIEKIFEVYVKNPNQLPYHIWPRGQKFESERNEQEVKHVAICNYIASMTDRFALSEYEKLFAPYKKV